MKDEWHDGLVRHHWSTELPLQNLYPIGQRDTNDPFDLQNSHLS